MNNIILSEAIEVSQEEGCVVTFEKEDFTDSLKEELYEACSQHFSTDNGRVYVHVVPGDFSWAIELKHK